MRLRVCVQAYTFYARCYKACVPSVVEILLVSRPFRENQTGKKCGGYAVACLDPVSLDTYILYLSIFEPKRLFYLGGRVLVVLTGID